VARSSRQLVLTQAADPRGDADEGLPALGTVREVIDALARYNTGPDGGVPKNGLGAIMMHGPGMVMEMAPNEGEVKQVMVTMTDDDFAFPVLMRLCREQRWTMLDPETGRRFGP
jgi:hypothetical protein